VFICDSLGFVLPQGGLRVLWDVGHCGGGGVVKYYRRSQYKEFGMSDFDQRRVMMVDTQIRPSDVTKFPIIDAMLKTRREVFVPSDRVEAAYVDDVLDLGAGRCLLDARSFAQMLDALDLQRDDVVLDIGCGLGYSSAILGHMVEAVVAIEHSDLAAEAQGLLAQENILNVAVLQNHLAQGAPDQGPYDAIILQGAIETLPDTIADQLAEGGRIVAIWRDGALGQMKIGYKIDGTVTWRFVTNASAPILSGYDKAPGFQL
ncbi:MAG: protein-L-isoaspartate O-methyltransferase, partial [Pseudomonadota bacterium]